LINEILFINFDVLKRTENIKKRGGECVSFYSIGFYVCWATIRFLNQS
jgi:hypothetical protein